MNYIKLTLTGGFHPIQWLLELFGKLLAFFNDITGSYMVAILLFAILAKIILFPFSIKQQKSTLKQARLRPKEQAIRNKYKGRTDQVSQNKMREEIMELYQNEGYSPFGGCLPLLIQFPIIIGLYQIIRNPLRYICGLSAETVDAIKNAIVTFKGQGQLSFAGTVAESAERMDELQCVTILSGKEDFGRIKEAVEAAGQSFGLSFDNLPNFKFFGFDLSVVPSDSLISLYILVPILTFAIMYFSMKLTRKLTYQPMQDDQQNMGCSTKIMDFTMPLMSTWIAFIVPSLLGVYWMFNNILGVLQSLLLKKMYPLPVFTPEDYKAAEREYKGKKPLNAADDPRIDKNKKYVSLHHIDDEDYDANGKYIGTPEKQNTAKTNGAAPQNNNKRPDNAPQLKEDKPHHNKKK